ncbi:hypothetical protein L7F22_036345 [Adiantum nelumboides]|nr:hypothetical protein [Adiantum nelumboides]
MLDTKRDALKVVNTTLDTVRVELQGRNQDMWKILGTSSAAVVLQGQLQELQILKASMEGAIDATHPDYLVIEGKVAALSSVLTSLGVDASSSNIRDEVDRLKYGVGLGYFLEFVWNGGCVQGTLYGVLFYYHVGLGFTFEFVENGGCAQGLGGYGERGKRGKKKGSKVYRPLLKLVFKLVPHAKVRGLRKDVTSLKSLFATENYMPEKGTFVHSTFLCNGEETLITDIIKASWDPMWLEVDMEFEKEASSKREFKFMSKKMFSVWEGNHRTEAWMEVISELFEEDKSRHVRVICTVIDPRKILEIALLASLQHMNVLNEHAMIKPLLQDVLINTSNICGSDTKKYIESLKEEENQLVKGCRSKESWFPFSRGYLARLVFQVEYNKEVALAMEIIERTMPEEQKRTPSGSAILLVNTPSGSTPAGSGLFATIQSAFSVEVSTSLQELLVEVTKSHDNVSAKCQKAKDSVVKSNADVHRCKGALDTIRIHFPDDANVPTGLLDSFQEKFDQANATVQQAQEELSKCLEREETFGRCVTFVTHD